MKKDNWQFDIRKNNAKQFKEEHIDEAEQFKNWNLRARKRRKLMKKWLYRMMIAAAIILLLAVLVVYLFIPNPTVQ